VESVPEPAGPPQTDDRRTASQAVRHRRMRRRRPGRLPCRRRRPVVCRTGTAAAPRPQRLDRVPRRHHRTRRRTNDHPRPRPGRTRHRSHHKATPQTARPSRLPHHPASLRSQTRPRRPVRRSQTRASRARASPRPRGLRPA
jgi:hypothetical protein